MTKSHFLYDDLNMGLIGQARQNILCHSGDRITMDWGYLYMASAEKVDVPDNGSGIYCSWQTVIDNNLAQSFLMLGYDDIASIQYFGTCCKAWGMRNGKTMPQALTDFSKRHDILLDACKKLDEDILSRSHKIGGNDYALIAASAWRHTFAAHKLIAAPDGEMVLLSKENDSNGCIGTVDISYPSVPLFLKYCPELVNALCFPVLQFASMPVWEEDFAPHDVGRYPYVTGQIYASKLQPENGDVPPPYYLYPAGTDTYDSRRQMPVEECGNMLIMMEAAAAFGASDRLLRKYGHLLAKWVKYLDTYGEDPGEQLCTDDFAGHLAHNVNLSAKAIVGISCYARILRRLGCGKESQKWDRRAKEMASGWLSRSQKDNGSPLTFSGEGWSMKYNLIWDSVLGLDLFPKEFYDKETRSYLKHCNEFGLPLDSRADYTKSDWLVWSACMSQDRETFCKLIAPLAHYLRTTSTRVPFSDWYDTKTGNYIHFIARSVQGGVYMPMLLKE